MRVYKRQNTDLSGFPGDGILLQETGQGYVTALTLAVLFKPVQSPPIACYRCSELLSSIRLPFTASRGRCVSTMIIVRVLNALCIQIRITKRLEGSVQFTVTSAQPGTMTVVIVEAGIIAALETIIIFNQLFVAILHFRAAGVCRNCADMKPVGFATELSGIVMQGTFFTITFHLRGKFYTGSMQAGRVSGVVAAGVSGTTPVKVRGQRICMISGMHSGGISVRSKCTDRDHTGYKHHC